MARYLVGIDLGTTNSAVAYVDASEAVPRVRPFPVPQLVAEGELGARPTLPSFLYLAGDVDLPPAATRLPWDAGARTVVGELARAQGARVPGRLVASSKSWLCHAGVDRNAAILPWGSGEGPRLSPVDAGARILEHVARAWAHAGLPALGAEEVVVTVPASFDEVARELTLAAAARAGLAQVTLVEEPQAVFYAWLDGNDAARRRQALGPGERVLVCDIGGGTTDFTLIEVGADGDSFERSAVGDHLLLGGDNIDIALAHRVEARLLAGAGASGAGATGAGTTLAGTTPAAPTRRLDAVQWQGLVHACRLAKEQLLAGPGAPDAVPVTVAARGARLLAGLMRGELRRAEVEELVLGGFFPLVARDARPERARAGLSELGLPYAADAAITRHLAAFLARHGGPRVDAVLFNGGATKPAPVRARVLDQLAAWQGARPRELDNAAPDLAVAHGAAYYGLVRRGLGARIRGGAARAYYVGVDGGAAVCVLPRGAEEGTEEELAQDLVAVMNRPVSFKLYSSSSRSERPGALVANAATAPDLLELPPLVTVLRAPGQRQARVCVRVRLTELGTLELWCVAAGGDEAAARWRLTFDLRSGGAPAADGAALPENLEALVELVHRSFRGAPDAPAPSALVKELERQSGARRDEWGTALARRLWDAVYACEPARAQSAEVEARWLNLAGFLLRPGAGAPLDDWRVREMWKIFNAGLAHDKDESCRLGLWIVFRRIAAGLKRTQQEQFYDRLAGFFVPALRKGKPSKLKPSPQETAEMWRTLASMERLVPSAKVRLGEALLERVEKGKEQALSLWALGRLGARAPLYGPADTVIPAEVASLWIERVLALTWSPAEAFVFPAAQLGRRTGDRARDIDDGTRARLCARLLATQSGERAARLVAEVVALEAREELVAFGDSLPAGLRLAGLDASVSE
jgi:molecular chaperone DnaK (HSP70)